MLASLVWSEVTGPRPRAGELQMMPHQKIRQSYMLGPPVRQTAMQTLHGEGRERDVGIIRLTRTQY